MAATTCNISFNSKGVTHQLALQLDPKQFSQKNMLDELASGRMYEAESMALFSGVLRDSDLFVDVGAHIGFFTLVAARLVGPGGRVVSFEPDQTNFDVLTRHIRENGLCNVVPIQAAVGETSGTAEFYLNSDNDGGHALWDVRAHSFNAQSRSNPVRTRMVEITSLDDVLGDDAHRVRALKIDTEGNELAVLRGAERTLSAADPLIVLEINRFGLAQLRTSERQVRQWLADRGFDAYFPLPDQKLMFVEPERMLDVGNAVFNMAFMRSSLAAQLLTRLGA